MSTRCNIVVKDTEGNGVILYHHCDGYPSGVGAHLLEIVKGKGFMDAFACANHILHTTEGENDKPFKNDFELAGCLAGDIEYLYTVKVDRYDPTESCKELCHVECRAYQYGEQRSEETGRVIDLAAEIARANFFSTVWGQDEAVAKRFRDLEDKAKKDDIAQMAMQYVASENWAAFVNDMMND